MQEIGVRRVGMVLAVGAVVLAGGESAMALARDTVFATVMIILDGIVGLCLLVGGRRFHEQQFGLYGVNAALSTLAAFVFLTLILPNFATTVPGPYYSNKQLGFVAIVSLVLYATFVLVQTVHGAGYRTNVDLAKLGEAAAYADRLSSLASGE